MAGNLLSACTALLPADTSVRYAWTAQKGLKPSWRFLSAWLIVFNQGRIVAVSDDRVYVFAAGRTKFSHHKPKRLLLDLPRADVYVAWPLKGSWTRLTFGSERMWVSRKVYAFVGKAFGPVPVA